MNKRNYKLYAIAFDGTLVENKYPEIGKTNRDLLNTVKRLEEAGDKWILWTARTGKHLEDAQKWCRMHDIHPVAFNANADDPALIKESDNNLHEIYADWYVDARNLDTHNFRDMYIELMEGKDLLIAYGKELRKRISEQDKVIKALKKQYKYVCSISASKDIQKSINHALWYSRKLRYRMCKAAIYIYLIHSDGVKHLYDFADQLTRLDARIIVDAVFKRRDALKDCTYVQFIDYINQGILTDKFFKD